MSRHIVRDHVDSAKEKSANKLSFKDISKGLRKLLSDWDSLFPVQTKEQAEKLAELFYFSMMLRKETLRKMKQAIKSKHWDGVQQAHEEFRIAKMRSLPYQEYLETPHWKHTNIKLSKEINTDANGVSPVLISKSII